jgi:hypothetical protein
MKFKFKISKKAQAEMIGLVIIVVLISLGMLFMAQFAINDKPEKKIFTRKGLAYSTMSSIMKTEVACYQGGPDPETLSIGKELIDDCAKNWHGATSEFSCAESYAAYNAGEEKHSCEFMQDVVLLMLNETLGVWNKDYQFRTVFVTGETGDVVVEVDNGGCATAKERDSSGLFPIYVKDAGLVENTLYLCD